MPQKLKITYEAIGPDGEKVKVDSVIDQPSYWNSPEVQAVAAARATDALSRQNVDPLEIAKAIQNPILTMGNSIDEQETNVQKRAKSNEDCGQCPVCGSPANYYPPSTSYYYVCERNRSHKRDDLTSDGLCPECKRDGIESMLLSRSEQVGEMCVCTSNLHRYPLP